MALIGKVTRQEIVQEMRESYLDYAMSVIVARALPDVRDGLKPVHRRILFVMHELGLHYNARFTKSANVVGNSLARYHPHGDTALYDAMVRMAQDFSLRYPLVDGQGNFGCFTKDTKVQLTDGRSLSFENLVKEYEAGSQNFTYTINNRGLVAIAEIKRPRRTQKNAALLRVTLDHGEEIRCTPRHLFMTRDGAYKEARHLAQGDSLMPFSQQRVAEKSDRLHRESYPVILQPKTNEWIPVHRLAGQDHLLHKLYRWWKTGLQKYFQNRAELIPQEIKNNHKVIRVAHLAEREDVYDLTIEGTHNFALAAGIFVHNSIDGDAAAAHRYTEARMTRIAEELLRDIEKDTVAFRDNYDGTRQEPVVLPSAVPNLLLNGTVGIAVGMATNIPPHHLGEVIDALHYLILHADATSDDLMNFIQGPDFPTGGIIFNQKAIREAYASGKGAILTRGRAEIQEASRGFQIIITEIPYQVNKSELIEKMANLVQEKRLEGIRDIRDESDKDGLRIAIDLKQDAQPQKVLNNLYTHTELEKSFHLNLLALVDGIQPQVLSIKSVLEEFVKHRVSVVTRRTQFDLARTRERIHILEGLKKALDLIDRIIETIKKSSDREDAHANLVKKFNFSDLQAAAILDMRLHTLAGLERQKIENELKEKVALARSLEALLKDPKKIRELIAREFSEIKERYADERRTSVIKHSPREFSEEDLIPDEEVVVVQTRGGYIKRIKPEQYRMQKRGGKGLIGIETKEEDVVEHLLTCSTHASLLFFTNAGKVYQVPAYEIPEGTRTAKGKAIFNFLSLAQTEQVASILAVASPKRKTKENNAPLGFVVMLTKNGIIKKVEADSFAHVRRSGLIAITLKGDDALRFVKSTSGSDELAILTAAGQAIRFHERDVRPMGRQASGVKAITLKKQDEVVGVAAISSQQGKQAKLLVVMARGYGKQTELKQYKRQHRGGSGIKTAKITDKTGAVVRGQVVEDQETELIAISRKGQVIKTEIAAVPTLGRATQGVRIMRLDANDAIASITTL